MYSNASYASSQADQNDNLYECVGPKTIQEQGTVTSIGKDVENHRKRSWCALKLAVLTCGVLLVLGAAVTGIALSLTSEQTLQQEIEELQRVLNSSLTEQIARIQTQVQNNYDTLSSEVTGIRNDIQGLQRPLGSFFTPARSCKDIPENQPSQEYWIQANDQNSPLEVYCDMNRQNCRCNGTVAGWLRVANLDMTDPNQECPSGFRLVNQTTQPLRTCGRPGPGAGCVSTSYSVHEVEYTQVCGRIRAYQFGTPDAFSHSLQTERLQ